MLPQPWSAEGSQSAATSYREAHMATLLAEDTRSVRNAVDRFMTGLETQNISIELRQDFTSYISIRYSQGDIHLNQAFDPEYTSFNKNDFWLLARGQSGHAIATYCVRRLINDDFYQLIRTQALWFSRIPGLQRKLAVECEIRPFGGEIAHGGGLWVRQDLRGSSRLAFVLPRLARALALDDRAFDHDTGMIRSAPNDSAKSAERKAVFAGMRTYGFARVSRFVDGWFPPEGRTAIMHLCHATKDEAIASLSDTISPARENESCGMSASGIPYPRTAPHIPNKQLVSE
jgi:hypothetical protein